MWRNDHALRATHYLKLAFLRTISPGEIVMNGAQQ